MTASIINYNFNAVILNLFQDLNYHILQLMEYCVYIMTNAYNTTLYVGMTNDLARRIVEHKDLIKGFTKQYRLTKLVYFEIYPAATEAIEREKQLKNWHREWKLNLIKENNPEFNDLFESVRS